MIKNLKTARFLFIPFIATVFMTFACATLVYWIEGPIPHSPINTFFDGLWWAMNTVTRVGYGDMVPVTNIGRLSAIVLAMTSYACSVATIGWILSRVFIRYKTERRT